MSPEDIVDRIGDVKQEIKELEAREQELWDQLGELEVGQSVTGSRFGLTVSANVRFDAATAKRNLTKKQFEAICKMTPNSALAKAVLEEDYHKTQRTSGVKRDVKPYGRD